MGLARGMGRRGVLAGAAALAGCQQPVASPTMLPADATPRLGPDGTGYINFQALIVNKSRDLFIAQVDKLLVQNATGIYVLISSPGGVVSAAQDMIAFMDRTHADRGVRFTMHNSGVVASAACYVFLAGQSRLSLPRGTFLFHEAAVVANGPISSQNLQEASANVQRLERSLMAMLTAKTHLTAGEASSFVRRTVILSADEARRDGIIDAIAGIALPPGATIYQIRSVPVPGAPAPARSPLPNGQQAGAG